MSALLLYLLCIRALLCSAPKHMSRHGRWFLACIDDGDARGEAALKGFEEQAGVVPAIDVGESAGEDGGC